MASAQRGTGTAANFRAQSSSKVMAAVPELAGHRSRSDAAHRADHHPGALDAERKVKAAVWPRAAAQAIVPITLVRRLGRLHAQQAADALHRLWPLERLLHHLGGQQPLMNECSQQVRIRGVLSAAPEVLLLRVASRTRNVRRAERHLNDAANVVAQIQRFDGVVVEDV